MLRNKILLYSLITAMTILPSFSAEILPDVEFPKPPAFRVGISDLPETQYIQAEEDKSAVTEKAYARVDNSREAEIADYTYADLDLKRMSKEISKELDYDGQDMLSDLSLLWQGAAMQSDTINFALYKLANPDADKPDEKSIKKVLTTIASMSTLVGASIGNPLIAGTSLISGNVLGIMTQDTKALNYKYTRVNDADMIILIRKVEDLQQRTVDLYYDYMSAKKQLEMVNELVDERRSKFEYAQANNAPRELVVITDAYYRTSLDKQRTAKSEFLSKRAALEQFVGNETLLQFENELVARENGEKKTTETADSQKQNEEYAQTVQNVEKYTENANKDANAIANDNTNTEMNNAKVLPIAQEADTVDNNVDNHNVQLRDYEHNKLNIAENNKEPNTNKVTGLSSNLEQDESEVSGDGSGKSKKKVKSEKKEKAEKPAKKNKVNEHLIFLHPEREGQAQQAQAESVKNEDDSLKSKFNFRSKSKEKSKSDAKSEPDNNAQTQTTEQTEPLKPVQQKPKPQNAIDTSGLMPLDEIKPPQLDGGYSIHSDYDYGDYYGDDSVPL